MSKRSDSDWQLLLQQQLDSGLSVKAFCKEQGLCRNHFAKRKQLLQGEASKETAKAFIQVAATPKVLPQPVVMKSGTVEVLCDEGVSPAWLAALFRELA